MLVAVLVTSTLDAAGARDIAVIGTAAATDQKQ